ncbi:hypothetical protein LTR17_017776 [Elasticomyces elasticus]|nr:hypothetical protein LTR17_017776 [Elasticomyces elasticus]
MVLNSATVDRVAYDIDHHYDSHDKTLLIGTCKTHSTPAFVNVASVGRRIKIVYDKCHDSHDLAKTKKDGQICATTKADLDAGIRVLLRKINRHVVEAQEETRAAYDKASVWEEYEESFRAS